MFGFKGALWMTQSCNDGSGCPFVQGRPGGSSYDQTNTWMWTSYARPDESMEGLSRRYAKGTRMARGDGGPTAVGGLRRDEYLHKVQRRGSVGHAGCGPEDAGGPQPDVRPRGRRLPLCVGPTLGAQDTIKEWATPEEPDRRH